MIRGETIGVKGTESHHQGHQVTQRMTPGSPVCATGHQGDWASGGSSDLGNINQILGQAAFEVV